MKLHSAEDYSMQNPATSSIRVSRCLSVLSLRAVPSGIPPARYRGIFTILQVNFREF
jgi:hypothetical protein